VGKKRKKNAHGDWERGREKPRGREKRGILLKNPGSIKRYFGYWTKVGGLERDSGGVNGDVGVIRVENAGTAGES